MNRGRGTDALQVLALHSAQEQAALGNLVGAAEWLDRLKDPPDSARDLLWQVRGGLAVVCMARGNPSGAEQQLQVLLMTTRWAKPLAEKRLHAVRQSQHSRRELANATKHLGDSCPTCRGDDMYAIATCPHQSKPLPKAVKLSPESLRPQLTLAYSAAAYRSGWDTEKADPGSILLRRLKEAGNSLVLDTFGRVLADFVGLHTAPPSQVDVVVPIPTAYDREQTRGTAIPGHLARVLAEWLGLPYAEVLVQTDLHVDHRDRNPLVRAASLRAAWRTALPSAYRDARLLLVDDVLTTGLTARVAAELLLAAGAHAAHLVTLFHTERST